MFTLIDFGFKTLAIFGIKVMAKHGDIIYWIKLENRSRNKRKAKSKSIIWQNSLRK